MAGTDLSRSGPERAPAGSPVPLSERFIDMTPSTALAAARAVATSSLAPLPDVVRRLGTAAQLLLPHFEQGRHVDAAGRWETDLSEATPGDPRDTTSPTAMTITTQALVLGDVLSGNSRRQLVAWLAANKVGDTKIRAGLLKDWRIVDKT